MADMGSFRTAVEIENLKSGASRTLADVLVDTGSEYTWIPRGLLQDLGIDVQRQFTFIVGDGRHIQRDLGYALIRAGGTETPTIVVFAEPGDMRVLGAMSLGGLNLKVDPVQKELVSAGPGHH